MPKSLRELDREVRNIFSEYKLYVVSLSEPYQHDYTLEGVQVKEPAGGLTAALDPILRKYGGTWIAAGTGDADWEPVDDQNSLMVPPDDPSYKLRRIKLPRYETHNYYYGFNHETIWPLMHTVFHRPDFVQDYWEGYKRANSMYARTLLEELDEGRSLVWFQDFQLTLAPRMVREELGGRELPMVHFWHVPWPPPEVFYRCPWAEPILKGLLANDLVGFHTADHAENFMGTVDQLDEAEVSWSEGKIFYEGSSTRVTFSPISVDFESIDRAARSGEVEDRMEELANYPYLQDKAIGLGIDRLDYAKGIPERLEAIDTFLTDFPEYKDNFLFVQAGAPLLSQVADYRNLTHRVETMIDQINQKHEQGSWRPFWFLKRKVDSVTLRALQRVADLYIVSSLHDGMNLVAKEDIAADVDCDGHLLLSEFTGASQELQEATFINPYDQKQFSRAVRDGLEMSGVEKERRATALRETVGEHDIYSWLGDFLGKAADYLSL